jgi:hypothetical protein
LVASAPSSARGLLLPDYNTKSELDFFILTKLSAYAIIDGVAVLAHGGEQIAGCACSIFAEEELS